MDFITILLTGVSLSMDAFAVSVTNGIMLKPLKVKYVLYFGLFFGFFQFLMPVIGYYSGKTFSSYIEQYDHYIAFILLAGIGLKMIYETLKHDDEVIHINNKKILDFRNMLMLAIATSIDAMAVGLSFSFFDINIYNACLVIGVTTFLLSGAGVVIGNKIGGMFKVGAERLGGLILICIGTKILIEHLFFLT